MNPEKWKYFNQKNQTLFPIDANIWSNESHGLFDIISPQFDKIEFNNKFQGLWKYYPQIPIINHQNIVSFGEGMTPVTEELIEDKSVSFKLEFLFPTGSYKDRGATVLISKVKELGIDYIIEDSSGNAGCAIAAYAAKAGIKCEIVVSSFTSPAKINQLKAYGAEVTLINGDRQKVADFTIKKAETVYYASHSWNPYFFQGTKTFAYEIYEQFNFQIPDCIVLPVGNGTLLIGAFIGFSELFNNQLIHKIPRFIAVQAENCSPLSGNITHFDTTMAEGIAVKNPIRKNQILEIIHKTGGKIITVKENEIQIAWENAASKGYYIEKTSASAWAAIKYLENNGKFLIPLTGHGLKNS